MADIIAEKEFENVAGGKAGELFSVNLTGPYWQDCNGSGSPNTLAISWPDIKAECVYPNAKCPYRLSRYGTYIGWTVAANFHMI